MALQARLASLRGASMTEYIIIVALVAVFLIGAVGLYGDTLQDIFVGSKTKLKDVKEKSTRGRAGGGHVVVD
jgi:Flp pilus assembly pilin Flp